MTEGFDLLNGVQPADDYDYFALPPVNPSVEPPMLIWGMAAAVLDDRPEVREFVRFFARPNFGLQGARQPVDRFIPARRTLMVAGCVDRNANLPTNGWRVRHVPGRPSGVGQRELAVRRVGRHATRRGASLLRRHDGLRGIGRRQPRRHPRQPRPHLVREPERREPASPHGRIAWCARSRSKSAGPAWPAAIG